jgi:hypothetical protein
LEIKKLKVNHSTIAQRFYARGDVPRRNREVVVSSIFVGSKMKKYPSRLYNAINYRFST